MKDRNEKAYLDVLLHTEKWVLREIRNNPKNKFFSGYHSVIRSKINVIDSRFNIST